MFFTKQAFLVACVSFVGALSAHQPELNKECRPLCPITPIPLSRDCCKNFHVDIGLLYLQPTIPNMFPGAVLEDLGLIEVADVEYVTQNFTDLLPCFDYALGLTASFGYLLEHDNWYVGVRFDWLSEDKAYVYDYSQEPTKEVYFTHSYIGTQRNDINFLSAMNSLQYDGFTKLNYSSSIDIYMLDVLLSRGSFHSSCFSYEPFTGVKALWFSTKQDSFFYSSTDTGFSISSGDNWGAGPMFGFNGEYDIVEGLSIFSDSDIALLFGEAKDKTNLRFNSISNDVLFTQYNNGLSSIMDCMIYVPVRTILGLKFATYCFEEKHHVALKIGYDVRAVMSFPETDQGFYMNGLYTNLVWNF